MWTPLYIDTQIVKCLPQGHVDMWMVDAGIKSPTLLLQANYLKEIFKEVFFLSCIQLYKMEYKTQRGEKGSLFKEIDSHTNFQFSLAKIMAALSVGALWRIVVNIEAKFRKLAAESCVVLILLQPATDYADSRVHFKAELPPWWLSQPGLQKFLPAYNPHRDLFCSTQWDFCLASRDWTFFSMCEVIYIFTIINTDSSGWKVCVFSCEVHWPRSDHLMGWIATSRDSDMSGISCPHTTNPQGFLSLYTT